MLSTFRITLRKDLRRTWPLLALLYAALAAGMVLWIRAFRLLEAETGGGPLVLEAGASGQRELMWTLGLATTVESLLRLTAMLAAGWAVLDDPPAGAEPFWATRPLSRGGLLLAKAGFLLGALALPMLAGRWIATSIAPELSLPAGWQQLSPAIGWSMTAARDLLSLGVAALLACFATSLRAWIWLMVVLFGVIYVLGLGPLLYFGSAGPAFGRGVSILVVVALALTVLAIGTLGWRYRHPGPPAGIGWLGFRRRPRRDRGLVRAKSGRRRRRSPGWLGEVGHHLRKDVRRIWPVVVVLAILLAYRLAEVLPAHPLAEERTLATWSPFHRIWLSLAVMLGVGLAVLEDPPRGSDPFWATRPVRPGALAAAKGAFAFGGVLVPILAAEAVALLGYGLDSGRLPAALVEATLSMAAPFAGGFAVAVLIPRLGAWLAVLVTLPWTAGIATGLLGLGFGLFFEQRQSLTGWILGHSAVVALSGLLLAGAYRRWRLRRTLAVAGAGFIGVVFSVHFWPWDFLQPRLQYRAAPSMAAPGEVAVEPLEPEARHVTWSSRDPGVPVQVRIAVHGLPDGVAVWGDVEAASLADASGEIDAGRLAASFGDRAARNAALGDLERLDELPRDRESQPRGHATLLYLPPEEFERLAERPVTFRGRLRLVPYRYVEHAEVPVAAAAGFRLRRGSYEVRVLSIDRSAETPGYRSVERDIALRLDGYGAGMIRWNAGAAFVKNARRGEAISIDGSRGGGQILIGLKGSTPVALAGSRDFSLVTPSPRFAREMLLSNGRFGWWWSEKPGAPWYDEATLLWLKRIEGRPFEVDLTIDDLILRREELESWRAYREERLAEQARRGS